MGFLGSLFNKAKKAVSGVTKAITKVASPLGGILDVAKNIPGIGGIVSLGSTVISGVGGLLGSPGSDNNKANNTYNPPGVQFGNPNFIGLADPSGFEQSQGNDAKNQNVFYIVAAALAVYFFMFKPKKRRY